MALLKVQNETLSVQRFPPPHSIHASSCIQIPNARFFGTHIVSIRIQFWGRCSGNGWSTFYVLGRPGTEILASLIENLRLVRRLAPPERPTHSSKNDACMFWLRDFSSGVTSFAIGPRSSISISTLTASNIATAAPSSTDLNGNPSTRKPTPVSESVSLRPHAALKSRCRHHQGHRCQPQIKGRACGKDPDLHLTRRCCQGPEFGETPRSA